MKTIVLSAGHGGRDPGAVGNGLRESDLNLTVTLAARDYLNKNYTGHKLILPRDRDVYVSLPARREMSRGADLYVSMHFNSFADPKARGFETFTHSGPLFETTLQYQRVLHGEVSPFLKEKGAPDRGLKRANHWVTKNMPCPTVLMEYLFVSSPPDAAIIRQVGVLQKLGELTGEGVAKSLGLQRKKPPDTGILWRVIAGSWRDELLAREAVAKLRREGYDAFLEAKHDTIH